MSGQTILVTGGAGYIGSHVCKQLVSAGHLPVVYDNLCTGNRGAVKWGPFEQGDIRDRARLSSVIRRYRTTTVMHFAALIQVADSVINPALYYENNVYGTSCLLEEMRIAGIRSCVFSSTAAVYGLPQATLLDEDHPLAPINPYGRTKLAAENMIRDYAAAYGINVAILRYFNAAGADIDHELGTAYPKDTHLVPLIMQVASGLRRDIQVFGSDYPTPDGTAMRDYIHVVDLANAHVRALDAVTGGKIQGATTLNLGIGTGYSVQQVIDRARAVTGHPILAEISDRRAGDPPVLVADASRARDVLGWVPQHSDLDTILSTAWAWRQKQNALGRTGAFTASTVSAFGHKTAASAVS